MPVNGRITVPCDIRCDGGVIKVYLRDEVYENSEVVSISEPYYNGDFGCCTCASGPSGGGSSSQDLVITQCCPSGIPKKLHFSWWACENAGQIGEANCACPLSMDIELNWCEDLSAGSQCNTFGWYYGYTQNGGWVGSGQFGTCDEDPMEVVFTYIYDPYGDVCYWRCYFNQRCLWLMGGNWSLASEGYPDQTTISCNPFLMQWSDPAQGITNIFLNCNGTPICPGVGVRYCVRIEA